MLNANFKNAHAADTHIANNTPNHHIVATNDIHDLSLKSI